MKKMKGIVQLFILPVDDPINNLTGQPTTLPS